MLRPDSCDYSHAYVVVKERITVTGTHDENRINKKLILKNNAPFRSCISKINNTIKTMQNIVILLCHYIIC